MRIVDLKQQGKETLRQAAQLLVDGFKENWPDAWPTLASAVHEVREALTQDRICRAATNEQGMVLGWVGAIPGYKGRAWELHPMVVRPDQQGQGFGRALVRDLEEKIQQRGAITLYLGTDDVSGMTTLANVDLYNRTQERIKTIKNLRNHPFEFYQKMGFTIVGVLPDANGPGKPDIFMAKRLSTQIPKPV